jgi:hypothetical protein
MSCHMALCLKSSSHGGRSFRSSLTSAYNSTPSQPSPPPTVPIAAASISQPPSSHAPLAATLPLAPDPSDAWLPPPPPHLSVAQPRDLRLPAPWSLPPASRHRGRPPSAPASSPVPASSDLRGRWRYCRRSSGAARPTWTTARCLQRPPSLPSPGNADASTHMRTS